MAKPFMPLTSKTGKSSTCTLFAGLPMSPDDAQVACRDALAHR